MGTLLKAEQGDDNSKNVYCSETSDKTEGDARSLAKRIAGWMRFKCTRRSISDFEDAVVGATEIWQKPHAEFMTLASDAANATEWLKLAVNQQCRATAPTRQSMALLEWEQIFTFFLW